VLTVLFYEAADGPPTQPDDLEDALLAIPGVELTGRRGDSYRSGQWRDTDTGASGVIDLGQAPLEEDNLHPPTAYDGWRGLNLSVQIPLDGPHWLCVEALQMIEGLLARLPQLRALDTEDTLRHDDGVVGPTPWSRPRLLASWERQHAVQLQGRTDCPRMNRLASVCLWRYRRERRRGQHDFPDLFWPEALVLLEQTQTQACSAAFWPEPVRAFALPPVEFIILRRPQSTGLLPAEAVIAAAHAHPLPLGQAAALTPDDRLAAWFATADLMPTGSYRALDDRDWTD
jgi:hypothetical protein